MQIPHPHQGFFELMRKLHSRGSSAPSALRCCPDQTLGLSESLESFISVKLQLFPQTVGGKACASMDTGQCQPRGDAGSFSPRNSFPSHRFHRVTHHPSHCLTWLHTQTRLRGTGRALECSHELQDCHLFGKSSSTISAQGPAPPQSHLHPCFCIDTTECHYLVFQIKRNNPFTNDTGMVAKC